MISENFTNYLKYFNKLTSQKIDDLLRKRSFKSNLLYKVLPEYPSRSHRLEMTRLHESERDLKSGNILMYLIRKRTFFYF